MNFRIIRFERSKEVQMGRISGDQRVELMRILEGELDQPVGVLLFTRQDGARSGATAMPICEYCRDVEDLMSELVSLTNRLSLTVLDFDEDRDDAEKYGVKAVPAIIPLGERNCGITYYGMPGGYEFASLLQALLSISSDTIRLSDDSLERISALRNEVGIEAFVTTTSIHCSEMTSTLYQLSLASEHVSIDVYEAPEFPAEVERYGIDSVPSIVLNKSKVLVGVMPEAELVDAILAVGQKDVA